MKVECMSWLLGDFWISGQAMPVTCCRVNSSHQGHVNHRKVIELCGQLNLFVHSFCLDPNAVKNKDTLISLILNSLIHSHLISGMIVISLKIPMPSKVLPLLMPCCLYVFFTVII